MNSMILTDKMNELRVVARQAEVLEAQWFDETPPPSSQVRAVAPPIVPVVHVGEFLGDPEVDSWLR